MQHTQRNQPAIAWLPLAAAVVLLMSGRVIGGHAEDADQARRSVEITEAQYNRATREAADAQAALDAAVRSNRDAGGALQAALDAQERARREIDDAQVNLPNLAAALEAESRGLEARRQAIAEQSAHADAANAEIQRLRNEATDVLQKSPAWLAIEARVQSAQTQQQDLTDTRMEQLLETDEYTDLLAQALDAEDEVEALRADSSADPARLAAASAAWIGTLNALENHESAALDADAQLRATRQALAAAGDERRALLGRFEQDLANSPPYRAALEVAARERATLENLADAGKRSEVACSEMDAQLQRLRAAEASAHQRLLQIDRDVDAFRAEVDASDHQARIDQASFDAALQTEAAARADRDAAAGYLQTVLSTPQGYVIDQPWVAVGSVHEHERGYVGSRERRGWERDRDHDHDSAHGRERGERSEPRGDGGRPRRDDDSNRGRDAGTGDGAAQESPALERRREEQAKQAAARQERESQQQQVKKRQVNGADRTAGEGVDKSADRAAAQRRSREEAARTQEQERERDGLIARQVAEEDKDHSAKQVQASRREEEQRRQREDVTRAQDSRDAEESARKRQQAEVEANAAKRRQAAEEARAQQSEPSPPQQKRRESSEASNGASNDASDDDRGSRYKRR